MLLRRHLLRAAGGNAANTTTSTAASTLRLLGGVRWHGGHDHGVGSFSMRETGSDHLWATRDWRQRAFTVGIGGPVGSGKTALVLQLCRHLRDQHSIAVVTNDIFTREDAEYLTKQNALPAERIRAVETGGCPHAAIREDVTSNLAALEDLMGVYPPPKLLLCESGGDNLAANFSSELADYTIYVIDVAGGDKVPRKGGPGVTQSDLLVINKIDLAEAVGADLDVMARDAAKMRGEGPTTLALAYCMPVLTTAPRLPLSLPTGDGPTVLAAVKSNQKVDEIVRHILDACEHATKHHGKQGDAHSHGHTHTHSHSHSHSHDDHTHSHSHDEHSSR